MSKCTEFFTVRLENSYHIFTFSVRTHLDGDPVLTVQVNKYQQNAFRYSTF